MMTAILLSRDLLFGSKLLGVAGQLGVQAQVARDVDALLLLVEQAAPACVLLDLDQPELDVAEVVSALERTCSRRPYLVAYGPHVHAPALNAARAAGCDLVLPRSKFVEELPSALLLWTRP